MRVETPCNILTSFAYVKPDMARVLADEVTAGRVNLMLDSGAFTAFKTGRKIGVEDYAAFLREFGHYAEKYVTLDVIGHRDQTIRNYERLVAGGLSPMFVVTKYDNDFAFVRQTLKVCPHICVAGGYHDTPWIRARYQQIYKETGAKIHGLAYVKSPAMFRLPLVSSDSSSWNYGPAAMGRIMMWDGVGVRQVCGYKDCLSGKRPVPPRQVEIMNQTGITPAMFRDLNNHKGQRNIEVFLAVIAYVKMQKFSQINGRQLFLAIGSLYQLQQILWVYKNFDRLNYAEYLKVFVK